MTTYRFNKHYLSCSGDGKWIDRSEVFTAEGESPLDAACNLMKRTRTVEETGIRFVLETQYGWTPRTSVTWIREDRT